jgi:hypothetical protein
MSKHGGPTGGDRPVRFTRQAAHRVGRVVRAFEQGDRDCPGQGVSYTPDDPEPVMIGKTTSTWTKGTSATITLYNEGSPRSEATLSPAATVTAYNILHTVESGRWVILGRAVNLGWYLLNWSDAGSS